MKKYSYYEPVFKSYITGIIEPNIVKAKKEVEKIIKEPTEDLDVEARTYEYYTKRGEQRILIYFRFAETRLLVHELVHAISFLFKGRNILFNGENDEVAAYYLEHLFKKFLNFLK